jgi:hypothetical protein
MKNFFTLSVVLLLALPLAAQNSEIEKRIRQELWVNCPKEFKSTTVPEKWKNESAVVLAFHREYIGDFTTKVTGLASINKFYIEKLKCHYRIKLLDKASVSEFSDISFNSKTIKSNLFGKPSTYRVIGIKVIKPDGTEKEVDLSQAVKADVTSQNELKIPIPNLETGDIVDYFMALRDESMSMPDFGDEYILEMKYPIVSNTISFSIPHQFQFISESYNGAPKFTAKTVDKDEVYTMKDEMREKSPDIIWHSAYQSAPHFRYRITVKKEKPDVWDEGKNLLSSFFNYNPSDIGMMVDYANINFKKTKDQKLLATEGYFLLRNPIYMKAYHNIEFGDPLGGPLSPNRFFLLYAKYLDKYKISYDIMLAPSRDYAPWEKLINLGACDLFMRVNTTPPIYVTRPTPFSLPNEISFNFEGMEGVNPAGKGVPLPVSTLDQNSTVTTIKAAISTEDVGQLNVERSIFAKGHNKTPHQYLVYTNYDYLKAYDLPKYQAQSSNLMRGILKDFNKEKTKFEQRISQDYHERDERIKSEIEGELEAKVTEYKNLKVKSIGMWENEPNTEYSDEYTIENLTKKVGPNIMVDIGKLIESQTEIKDEQKNRTRDVYMAFARSFTNEISFTIPAGYKAEGIESLNMKSENDTGGFVSSASVTGNILTIKTRKYYTRNYYKASEWNKLLPFLTAANKFYSSKILLKKG